MKFWIGALLLTLAGCAPTVPTPSPLAGPADQSALRERLAALPGAVPLTEGRVGVSYPEETLYARGAVLPLVGGGAMLNPLADLLRGSGLGWSLTLHAASDQGPEYDLRLAQARADLLLRYLEGRGVPRDRLRTTVLAEGGAALTVEALEGESQVSSAEVKR